MKSVIRTLCAAGVAVSLAGFATGAAAQDQTTGNINNRTNFQTGLYVGGGIGWANSKSNDELSWKGLVGWRLNQYLSVQGFYAGLGDHRSPVAPFTDEGVETFGAEALVAFPLSNNVSLFGKGGFHRYDIDNNGDGTSWLAGAGLDFAFSENMSLRAEWTRYDLDSFDDVDDFGAQLIFAF